MFTSIFGSEIDAACFGEDAPKDKNTYAANLLGMGSTKQKLRCLGCGVVFTPLEVSGSVLIKKLAAESIDKRCHIICQSDFWESEHMKRNRNT